MSWQSIDSAPKDRRILVFVPGSDPVTSGIFTAQWQEYSDHRSDRLKAQFPLRAASAWFESGHVGYVDEAAQLENPTFWMELPEVPANTAVNGA